jgi:Rho-type GTPase-activating protein 1/2
MLHLHRFVCPPTFPLFLLLYIWHTLLMVQLFTHRIQEHHEENLMTARNLGVIFGRMYHFVAPSLCVLLYGSRDTAATLMRSRNPAAEFSDMAGKALTIEWLVENAPTIFPPMPTSI